MGNPPCCNTIPALSVCNTVLNCLRQVWFFLDILASYLWPFTSLLLTARSLHRLPLSAAWIDVNGGKSDL